MMTTERAEKYRRKHPLGFEHKQGDNFGWFQIERIGKPMLAVMVAPTDGEWQHVSVSCRNRTPTWDEMCFIKNLFWDEEDVVVQFHPRKSDYVNIAENCLHLWSYKGGMPTPPRWMV